MEALRIGRIFGIDIRIHWSWLAIFFLLLWWLAEGFFDDVNAYSHWSTSERWVASGITTILFFVSILLHELSHSLVARRLGLPVHSIPLFIFGGVSSLTQEPDSPGQEFKMAIVGPLMSFALGILAAAIAAGLWANGLDETGPGAGAAVLAFSRSSTARSPCYSKPDPSCYSSSTHREISPRGRRRVSRVRAIS